MKITERLNQHISDLTTQLLKTFESTELPLSARPYFDEAQRVRQEVMDEYKKCLHSIDTLSSISSLFPDDAPHKHPETGVSLLDDVRDALDDIKRYRYQARDMQYEVERHKQYLEIASHQINHLKGMNDSLLKALAEPLKTHIQPMYIMKSNSGTAVAATKALDVLSAVNQIGAISWNKELKRSVEDAIAELRKVL